MIDQAKWDRRFLDLAAHVAQWSKDPSTKVGAVIACGKREYGMGYNGFREGEDDSPHLYTDREYKLKHIVHAELNAVIKAFKVLDSLKGCTLYTWPFQPCHSCACIILKLGIVRVVAPILTGERLARWGENMDRAAKALRAAGIEVVLLEVPT